MNKLFRIVKEPALIYVLLRYTTYALQFFSSLLIAYYFGAYYLGIWGFFMLFLNIANQVNFGIPSTLTALFSINRDDRNRLSLLFGTGIGLMLLLSLIMAVVVYFLQENGYGEKYEFETFGYLVIVSIIVNNINTLFINILRVYGKVIVVGLMQMIGPLLLTSYLLISRSDSNLVTAISVWMYSYILAFSIGIIFSPLRPNFKYDIVVLKNVLKRGMGFFVYSVSFYFILYGTRGVVSYFYSVSHFGKYSFAFSLANAFFLLLQSVGFMLLPKMINRMAMADESNARKTIDKVFNLYTTSSHFLSHFFLAIYPVVLLFFLDYSDTSLMFVIMTITLVVYTNGFALSSFLIAKSKESRMALITSVACFVNLFFSIVLGSLGAALEVVIVGSLLAYVILVLGFARIVFKEIRIVESQGFLSYALSVIPFRHVVPLIVVLALSSVGMSSIAGVISLLVFIVLNRSQLSNFFRTIKNLSSDRLLKI